MFVYSLKTDVDKKDAVVLRILGDIYGMGDNDMQIAAMQVCITEGTNDYGTQLTVYHTRSDH